MKCPVCDIELKMAEREGVEIDYCQKCRGIWLDRGELDKIIDKSTSFRGGEGEEREDREDDFDERDPRQRRRRRSFKDFFDF